MPGFCAGRWVKVASRRPPHLCKGQLPHPTAIQAGNQGIQLSKRGNGAPTALQWCRGPKRGEGWVWG